MPYTPFKDTARLFSASSVFSRRLEYLTLPRQDEQTEAKAASFILKSSLERGNSFSLYKENTNQVMTCRHDMTAKCVADMTCRSRYSANQETV